MATIEFDIGHGAASAVDPSTKDMLQESTGVVYKPGDPAVHKFPGRTAFNASAIASDAVDAIEFVDTVSANAYVYAALGTAIYAARVTGTTAGTFSSIRSGSDFLTTSFQTAVMNGQVFCCAGDATSLVNFVIKSGTTTYRWGLSPATTAPTAALVAGPGITGTYKYWTTEYDSTNDVESAVGPSGGGYTGTPVTVTAAPANQIVRITKPTTVNSSADKWRIYRTIASGAHPIGWRVAEVAIATTTYDDSTTDTALVLLSPYPIVTINGVSEAQNFSPESSNSSTAGFSSVAAFQGSLVGTNVDAISWSETLLPHYFPKSYRMRFNPKYGGSANCVRVMAEALYVFFPYETFRVNYLPKGFDSVFDTGIASEDFANYGTESHMGACTFSGWGGRQVMFVASAAGPMLMNADGVDRAVAHIDWANIVDRSRLSLCKVIDNPDRLRVEMYFIDTDSNWNVLHFYYDPDRLERSSGPFPEMVWTGPHRVPGHGTYGIVSGVPVVYTGSKSNTGIVYLEDSGVSDAAQLIDSDGTINFRMRTGRKYPQGPNAEMTAKRVWIHKQSAGTGTYDATVTAHREEQGVSSHSRTVDATVAGFTSHGLNCRLKGVDVRVVRDDAVAMPPINKLFLTADDVGPAIKDTPNS